MSGNKTAESDAGVLLVLATAMMLVVGLAPGVAASVGDYGTLVGESSNDDDLTGLLLLTPSASIQFDDVDGSGGFNCPSSSDCDHIYINIGGGSSVGAGDIRLFHDSLSEGAQVETTDDDFGASYDGTLSGGLTFIDLFPHKDCPEENPPCDGNYNAGEPIYVDTDNSGDLTSSDIEVISKASDQNSTGSSSYQKVSSSEDRLGNNTNALPGQIAVLDANADGSYNIGDTVFRDVDSDGLATPGDIQFNQYRSATRDTDVLEVGDDLTVSPLGSSSASSITFSPRFAWNDADTDGTVDDSETIYIDVDGSGPVSRFDITIGPVSGSSSTSSGAGEQVDAGDSELGSTVSLTGISTGNVKYNDNNGNGVVDSQDDLYIDVDDSNSQVEAGDLILADGEGSSVGSPGSRVSSGDSEVGNPLQTPSSFPGFEYVDFNQGGYGINDAIFLDWDSNNVVSPGDVLVSEGKNPMDSFGEFMEDSSQEANLCYRFSFGGYDAGWIDEGSPSVTNPEEGVYLDRNGNGQSSILDVRLSAGGSDSAGTFLESADTDQGNGLTSFGATPALPLYFHDSNGDGTFSLAATSNGDDDAAYLDVTTAGSDTTIAVGDVRLTEAASGSGSPGSKVRSGESDTSLPISQLSGFAIRGIDNDGDGTFDPDDEIYANLDEASEGSLRCPSPGDLRLSGSGGASSTTSSGGGGGGGGGTGGTTGTPPSVSISSPSDGAIVEPDQTVSITGSASGGSDTISSVSVTADGESLTVQGTSSWSTSWGTPATEGSYTITATVTDSEGEQRSNTLTLEVGQDSDGDGVADHNDNCPDAENADQTDSDGDGVGDACADQDGDGVVEGDNCPETPNPDQADLDGDGIGDACDDDIDGDGVPNDQDAVPRDERGSTDDDLDGVPDEVDNCPGIGNPDQADMDGDGDGDKCDDDIDGDGLNNTAERELGTDRADADTDGDGVEDGEDNCPATENADQADADGDGIGDECDPEPNTPTNGTGTNGSPGPGLLAALLATGIAIGVRRRS